MKSALHLALIVLCLTVSGSVLWIAHSVAKAEKAVSDSTAKLDKTADALSQLAANTDQRLNRDGGLLQVTQKAIGGVKSAAIEAAIAEKTYSQDLKTNSDRITSHLDATLAGLDKSQAGIAEDVHETSLQVRTALDAVSPLLNQGTQTLKDADSILANSNIPETLGNINLATAHTAETLGHVDAMTADLQKSLHKTLNPSKGSMVIGWAWTLIKAGATVAPIWVR